MCWPANQMVSHRTAASDGASSATAMRQKTESEIINENRKSHEKKPNKKQQNHTQN